MRSGLARMASSCRMAPSGCTLRWTAARTIAVTSSVSKCGPAMSRKPSTPRRTASSSSVGRGVVIEAAKVGSSRNETVP